MILMDSLPVLRVPAGPFVKLHIVLGLGATVLLHLPLDVHLMHSTGSFVDSHGLGDLLHGLSLAEEFEVLGFSGSEHEWRFTQEEA